LGLGGDTPPQQSAAVMPCSVLANIAFIITSEAVLKALSESLSKAKIAV